MPSGRLAARHSPAAASLTAEMLQNCTSSLLPLEPRGTPHPGDPVMYRRFPALGSGSCCLEVRPLWALPQSLARRQLFDLAGHLILRLDGSCFMIGMVA